MITIPKRRRGRQSAQQAAAYRDQLKEFAGHILQIRSRIDFTPGSRGWCYLLEGESQLLKSDFDEAQSLIGDCRKRGILPLDIVAEDTGRLFDNLECVTDCSSSDFVGVVLDSLPDESRYYLPFSFWDYQQTFVQMVVEKIDLKSLFAELCSEFCIPLASSRGWADINLRAGMMQRFKEHEQAGRQCVLLYCGDHDPVGLKISEQLRANLSEIEAVQWDPSALVIDRFGLNYDFIESQGLPWIENLVTGGGKDLANPRHKHHHHAYVQEYLAKYGARKCEANALVLRAEAGRQLCRDAIERYVDLSAKREFESDLAAAQDEVRRGLEAIGK